MIPASEPSVAGACDSVFGPGPGNEAPLTDLPRPLGAAEQQVVEASNRFASGLLREASARTLWTSRTPRGSLEIDAVRPPSGVRAMSNRPVVHSHPEIVSGEPVFIGTRVPVRNLLDWLEGGHTLDEFLDNFPSVTREQAVAFLEQASAALLAGVARAA